MKKEKEFCAFCKLLVSNLEAGEGHFKDYPEEIRKELLSSMNTSSKHKPLNLVRAYCRGFGLCSKHADTIKRDNKMRAKNGLSIPNDLSIKNKLRLYDW